MANGTVLAESKDTISILTYGSVNRKTGPMDQTWHLHKHFDPITARQMGLDRAVCFDCPLAGNQGCYVDIGKSAAGVWKAWRRGGYTKPLQLGRPIRFGAYGEPTLLPIELIKKIHNAAPVVVGYTHRWKEPCIQEYKGWLMASVDNPIEQMKAAGQGWRTFRTVRSYKDIMEWEQACGNTKTVQCIDCAMCTGTGGNVVLKAHGQLRHRVPCCRPPQLDLQCQ